MTNGGSGNLLLSCSLKSRNTALNKGGNFCDNSGVITVVASAFFI